MLHACAGKCIWVHTLCSLLFLFFTPSRLYHRPKRAGASFFSSPEQIAKREELEAQLKAAKQAEDEAALKAKKENIALEKELRKSRVSMAGGTGEAAAQARKMMLEMKAKAEAEEAVALQARKDLIAAEKARKAAAGEQPSTKSPSMGSKRKTHLLSLLHSPPPFPATTKHRTYNLAVSFIYFSQTTTGASF